MKKNRRIVSLIALCLTALIAVAALAEGPLTTLYSAATTLLFDTPNATLTIAADFAYNGVHFKHLDGRYVQDGSDSLMELSLKTPKKDGSIQQSGYTVVGNGGTAYTVNQGDPYYLTSNCGLSESILSSSVMRRTILRFGSALMSVSESAFQDKISQSTLENGGTQYRIALQSGDTPELLNAAGTLMAQLAANKYFYINYDETSTSQNQGCEILYQDYESLFAAVYQRLYGERLPENFYDLLWDNDSETSSIYYERYNAVSRYLSNELFEQLRHQYDHGVALVRGDESVQFFETYNEYCLAVGDLNVYYEDQNATFRAFYESETGTPLTQAELDAIFTSNNDELWAAYSLMLEKMDAKYRAVLAQDGRHSCIIVSESGDYRMIEDKNVYYQAFANQNQTVTRRILNDLRDLELDQSDVTVEFDAQGRLSGASGSVRLIVVDTAGTRNTLDVTFSLTVGSYGDSTVEVFDPKKYNVMSSEEYYAFIEGGGSLADLLPAAQQEETRLPETVTFDGVKYQVTLENLSNG